MTALTVPSTVVEQVGGFPFLDPEFAPGRLLTAAACCRWTRAHPHTAATPTRNELTAVLQPERARQIRRLDLHLDLPHGDLTEGQHHQVAQTRAAIVRWLPDWAPLIELPLRFHALIHSEAISASVFAWPQHIFLADSAFASPTTLAEQITHETSHQWLYLIEELWPLQRTDATRIRVTLPSGTPGRSPAELLGASHVAVNLRRLWTHMPTSATRRRDRLAHLHDYGSACAHLLADVRDALTADGQALARRLTQELTTR